MDKLIRGEYIPILANKILVHYDQLFCNPFKINDGDIVYCDTHHILRFKDILNIKKDITIITHNSDYCLYDGSTKDPNGVNVEEFTSWKRWYGQNSYSIKDNVIPLPIGFENLRWEKSFGPKTKWMQEVKDEQILCIYNKYLRDKDRDSNQTKVNEDMGFLSSISEARVNLEKLYKSS